MMYYSTLLILIICNPIVYGAKVIDRFGGFYRKDLPCKFWMPESIEVTDEMQEGSDFKTSVLLDPLKVINCTIVRTKGNNFGYPLDNGSYTGLIGIVQRRESDLMLIAVRPDNLPHEPALIGPMLLEADASNYFSQIQERMRVTREILELVNDVDHLVYAYFGISIIVFSVCYTISIVVSKAIETEDWDALTVGKDFLETIWQSCAAVLDQEQFSPENYSTRILTLFLHCGSLLRNLWHVSK